MCCSCARREAEEAEARRLKQEHDDFIRPWLWIMNSMFPESAVYAALLPGQVIDRATANARLKAVLRHICSFIAQADVLSLSATSKLMCYDSAICTFGFRCKVCASWCSGRGSAGAVVLR
jgi:hypothetical protein